MIMSNLNLLKTCIASIGYFFVPIPKLVGLGESKKRRIKRRIESLNTRLTAKQNAALSKAAVNDAGKAPARRGRKS